MKDTERTRAQSTGTLARLAFLAGCAVPIGAVVLSFGYAQYVEGVRMGPPVVASAHEFARLYIPFVYLPALVLVAGVAWYCRGRYPSLFRRIVVGASAGAIATLALDAVRQAGVIRGWLPEDMTVMFGMAATGSSSLAVFWPAGLAIHFLNGANFGLFYAFVWGKRGSLLQAAGWGTVWLLVVELGMMTLPPMGPMTGLFGTDFGWPELFLVTLVAHVFFGLALGPLVEVGLTDADRGSLVPFLLGLRASAEREEAARREVVVGASPDTVDLREPDEAALRDEKGATRR